MESHKSHLAWTFCGWSARVWLHRPGNGAEERVAYEEGGMGAGHENRQVCPGDVQMHRLAYTTAPCNPPRKRSISSIWDCSIFAVHDLFVSAWRVWLWSLGISAQTNTFKWIPCGKPAVCWLVKGESPLCGEIYCIYLQWDRYCVLKIIFTINVEAFSVRVPVKWFNSAISTKLPQKFTSTWNFCSLHFSLCYHTSPCYNMMHIPRMPHYFDEVIRRRSDCGVSSNGSRVFKYAFHLSLWQTTNKDMHEVFFISGGKHIHIGQSAR